MCVCVCFIYLHMEDQNQGRRSEALHLKAFTSKKCFSKPRHVWNFESCPGYFSAFCWHVLIVSEFLLQPSKGFYRSCSGWWVQWIECQPVNQRVTGSIPNQGTYLGCWPGPQVGTLERQPHIDVSLPLFLSPFPSL